MLERAYWEAHGYGGTSADTMTDMAQSTRMLSVSARFSKSPLKGFTRSCRISTTGRDDTQAQCGRLRKG